MLPQKFTGQDLSAGSTTIGAKGAVNNCSDNIALTSRLFVCSKRTPPEKLKAEALKAKQKTRKSDLLKCLRRGSFLSLERAKTAGMVALLRLSVPDIDAD
jgi:hypothetical protein